MLWRPSKEVWITVALSAIVGFILFCVLMFMMFVGASIAFAQQQDIGVIAWSRMDDDGTQVGVMCYQETSRCALGADMPGPQQPTVFAAGPLDEEYEKGMFCFEADVAYSVPVARTWQGLN